MLVSFFRSIIIYIFLVIAMRLMGKKQLGELQPFEFVITLVASELACIPLSDMQTPLFYGFIPIITLLALDVIMTKIVKHSIKLRAVINGRPVIVIDKNGINSEAMTSLDMNVHDILEGIRSQGYLSPNELEYCIVETNGNISCIPKGNERPAKALDVKGDTTPPQMPYTIISEGKLLSHNLRNVNLEESYIFELLKKYNLKQKDVLFLGCTNEEYYLQPLNKPYIAGEI